MTSRTIILHSCEMHVHKLVAQPHLIIHGIDLVAQGIFQLNFDSLASANRFMSSENICLLLVLTQIGNICNGEA